MIDLHFIYGNRYGASWGHKRVGHILATNEAPRLFVILLNDICLEEPMLIFQNLQLKIT